MFSFVEVAVGWPSSSGACAQLSEANVAAISSARTCNKSVHLWEDLWSKETSLLQSDVLPPRIERTRAV